VSEVTDQPTTQPANQQFNQPYQTPLRKGQTGVPWSVMAIPGRETYRWAVALEPLFIEHSGILLALADVSSWLRVLTRLYHFE
jgi:hypothetical protein